MSINNQSIRPEAPIPPINREALPSLDSEVSPQTVNTPLPAVDDGGEGVLSGQNRDLAGDRPGTPKKGRPSHAE